MISCDFKKKSISILNIMNRNINAILLFYLYTVTTLLFARLLLQKFTPNLALWRNVPLNTPTPLFLA